MLLSSGRPLALPGSSPSSSVSLKRRSRQDPGGNKAEAHRIELAGTLGRWADSSKCGLRRFEFAS